jgi:hypothetical protein
MAVSHIFIPIISVNFTVMVIEVVVMHPVVVLSCTHAVMVIIFAARGCVIY